MFLEINPASAVPIYAQILDQIKYAIAAGAVGEGEKLPTVRSLAVQLRINPNTVGKAYRELEREGIVNTRVGDGTFVAAGGTAITKRERVRIVGRLVDNALVQAFHLALHDADVRKVVEERLKNLKRRIDAEVGQKGKAGER